MMDHGTIEYHTGMRHFSRTMPRKPKQHRQLAEFNEERAQKKAACAAAAESESDDSEFDNLSLLSDEECGDSEDEPEYLPDMNQEEIDRSLSKLDETEQLPIRDY